MARSANTPIDFFYDGVVITLNYNLPTFVNWFPRLFASLVKSFTRLVENFSFDMVFVKTFVRPHAIILHITEHIQRRISSFLPPRF